MSQLTTNYVKVEGIWTKVLTLGCPLESPKSKILLILPGNPGLSGFYATFMQQLRYYLCSDLNFPPQLKTGLF